MTLEEFDKAYPNGLDAARITSILIDYARRDVALKLDMRVQPPESPGHDQYSSTILDISGFYYLSIEPPSTDHLGPYSSRYLTVDGLAEDAASFPLLDALRSKLAAGAFYCRFYVHDWNSFIHVAAEHAELRLSS